MCLTVIFKFSRKDVLTITSKRILLKSSVGSYYTFPYLLMNIT